MPSCSPASHLVPVLNTPRTTRRPATSSCASNADKAAATQESALTLPGLSVVSSAHQASTAIWSLLDSYLVTKFVPFVGGSVNCFWMYKDYQKTIKSQGLKEVVSPAMFITTVIELAKSNWSVTARPVKTSSENGSEKLQFKGFICYEEIN